MLIELVLSISISPATVLLLVVEDVHQLKKVNFDIFWLTLTKLIHLLLLLIFLAFDHLDTAGSPNTSFSGENCLSR